MSKRRNKCPHCKGTGVKAWRLMGFSSVPIRCAPCAGTGILVPPRKR